LYGSIDSTKRSSQSPTASFLFAGFIQKDRGNPSYSEEKEVDWLCGTRDKARKPKRKGPTRICLLMQVAWDPGLVAAFQPAALRMGCNNLGMGCGTAPAQEAAEMAPEDLEETMRRLEDQLAHMEKASTGQ
jgi:hypothetical protein